MRLKQVETGHGLGRKLLLKLIGLMQGFEAPDVVKTLMYRPEYLGKPLTEVLQAAIRGPSEWSIGERELFAAFTSRLNQCFF
jgi:hypothetical protein